MTIEKTIESAKNALDRADGVTSTISGANKRIGALIVACGYLVEIIEDQQAAIEREAAALAILKRIAACPDCRHNHFDLLADSGRIVGSEKGDL